MSVAFNKTIFVLLLILTFGHLPDAFLALNLAELPIIKQALSLYFEIDPLYAAQTPLAHSLGVFSASLMFPLAVLMCFLYVKESKYYIYVNLFYCGLVLSNMLIWLHVILTGDYLLKYPTFLYLAASIWILIPIFLFFYNLNLVSKS